MVFKYIFFIYQILCELFFFSLSDALRFYSYFDTVICSKEEELYKLDRRTKKINLIFTIQKYLYLNISSFVKANVNLSQNE